LEWRIKPGPSDVDPREEHVKQSLVEAILLNCHAAKSNAAFNSVSSSFDFDENNDFICSSQ
jgi:hypothetical protein